MSEPGSSTKHCPNCGAEVRSGDYICENCGTPLPSEPMPAPPPDREGVPEEPAAGAPDSPPAQSSPPEQTPGDPAPSDTETERSDTERPDTEPTEAEGPDAAPPYGGPEAPEQPPSGEETATERQPAPEESAAPQDAAPPGEPARMDLWKGSGRGGFVPEDPTFGGEAPPVMAGSAGGGGSLLLGTSPVRQVVLGAVLAAGTVVSLLVVFYLILALRWLLGVSGAPGLSGIFGFVAAHGGAVSAEVPETPALLGLGGTLTVDPPLTTLALLPFLVLLAGSWLLSRRVGTSLVFVGALGAVYAVLLALLALVGGTSTALGEGTELSISASPLSAALHGFLIAALGGLVGVIAARGPLLPDRARQVVKGALLAVLVSVVLAVILTIILSLVVSVPENPLQDLQPDQQPTDGQPSGGSADDEGGFGALLATVGSFVALLPAGVGTLWLLAHGIPVGVQNAPDLGNLPGVGAGLADATLSAGLLSDWPFSGAWRLLLLAPVVGLVVGGAVAARGAGSPRRLLYGALICVPYFVVVLLTAVMARIGLSVSVAGLDLDTAIGAALFPWTLLVLPAAAIFGTVGALLAPPGAIPVPRPRLAGAITAVVCALLLVGTLPLLAASNPEPPVPPAVGGLAPGATPEATIPEVTSPEATTPAPEVPGPEETEAEEPSQPTDPASSPEGEFITRYYSAAAQEDWAGTYALLASESQAEFTQEEWVEKQSTYIETSDAPLVQSAEVTQVTSQGSESVVNVTVTYEDGSQNVLPAVELVEENGELRRRLTDAEIERVRSVPS